MNDRDLKERAAKVEALIGEIESFQEPEARAKTTEMLQALLQLYGEGLARILEIVARRDQVIVDLLARDELIAHLLYLHGLHPVPVERRVAVALEEVRPFLQSHGATVELVDVEQGVVRLRLHGTGQGCGSSTVALKPTIEETVRNAAPDLVGIEVDEVKEVSAPYLIPLSAVSRPEAARG